MCSRAPLKSHDAVRVRLLDTDRHERHLQTLPPLSSVWAQCAPLPGTRVHACAGVCADVLAPWERLSAPIAAADEGEGASLSVPSALPPLGLCLLTL